MKRFLFLFAIMITAAFASAQIANPVRWTFSSKKTGAGFYEVQMTATLQNGWHLYSQTQPSDAIAVPTTFEFTANPLLQFSGRVLEAGKLQKFTDKELGVSAHQYSNKVVFTQKVKVKGKAKTTVAGNITYQTCNDQKCLPAKTVSFNVALL